ncbi:MAG: hypothetical protein KGL53_01350, partial [Elusimicrobia bacterium]|nr:hypothetical protein [Elusimicrobiota bacterium]
MLRLLAALALAAVPAAAGPLSPQDVPSPLKPWVKWALRGHEDAVCPFLNSQGAGSRGCAWPGTLRLDLDGSGGRFSQPWRLYAEAWAALPGGSERWPQDVTVDGRPAAVVSHDGAPAVRLAAGAHVLAGRFAWRALPELLEVPDGTGLLSLRLGGAAVALPERDDAG